MSDPSRATLTVTGMHCDGCVRRVVSKVGELPGVQGVEVTLADGKVTVAWGDGFAGLDAVKERIAKLGYQAT